MNPYAPPQPPQPMPPPAGFPAAPYPVAAQGAMPGAHVALFTSNQVVLATFFGTVLGGSAVMALNEYRLGRGRACVTTLLLGALGAAVLVVIAFVTPDKLPGQNLMWIVPLFVMRAIADRRQKAIVGAHLQMGGKKASSWAAFGLGMASLVVVIVPVFAIAVLLAFAGVIE